MNQWIRDQLSRAYWVNKRKRRIEELETALRIVINSCHDLTEDPPSYGEIADYAEGILTGRKVLRDQNGQRVA